MNSLEHYLATVRTQNELKKMLKGKLTREIALFIEYYPLYLKNLVDKYGGKRTVNGFMQAYSGNPYKPSFSELEKFISEAEC